MQTTMEVIPAIDLIDGQCVRLYRGDYDRKTVFADDPAEVAARWERLGARRIHIVDLDGAKAGSPQNLAVVRRIAASVSVPIQLGGGIRSLESARATMDAGASRVMLGTVAIRDPCIVADACAELGPDGVVVAIDSRDGIVAFSGWTDSSSARADDLMRQMQDAGVETFLCTDISRDGTLEGPNCALMADLVAVAGAGVLAAGGIASVEHIQQLSEIGVGGAVIGRALYTGDIDLTEAIAAAERAQC